MSQINNKKSMLLTPFILIVTVIFAAMLFPRLSSAQSSDTESTTTTMDQQLQDYEQRMQERIAWLNTNSETFIYLSCLFALLILGLNIYRAIRKVKIHKRWSIFIPLGLSAGYIVITIILLLCRADTVGHLLAFYIYTPLIFLFEFSNLAVWLSKLAMKKEDKGTKA